MSVRDTGGPAFPAPEASLYERGVAWAFPGMTLRDYFAAAAMQGDIASMSSESDPGDLAVVIASRAYAIADAMLVERAK